MAKQTTYQTGFESLFQKIDDYKQLVKFRLNLMVVISALLAYCIAAGEYVSFREIILLLIGGFLVTGASNALNQVLEKDYDRMMKRTENRPIPQGRMSISDAVLTAGWMSVLGLMLLALINPIAGVLGAISLVLYAFLYTPLKRLTPFSVIIGAIPGAMPALIGSVAFEGGITVLGLILFGIMFFWQFPHFWAIADLAKDDYRKAGFQIIGDDADAKSLGIQSLIYAAFLLPLIGGLYTYEYIGLVNLSFMVVLTMIYMWFCFRFSKEKTRKSALKLMFSSFFYLPLVFGALVVQQFLG